MICVVMILIYFLRWCAGPSMEILVCYKETDKMSHRPLLGIQYILSGNFLIILQFDHFFIEMKILLQTKAQTTWSA